MRITVKTKELKNLLKIAKRGAAAKCTLPVLQAIRCLATGNNLAMVACDLEIMIGSQITCVVTEDGEFGVNLAQFESVIPRRPKADETMELWIEEGFLHVKDRIATNKIQLIEMEEFPEVAKIKTTYTDVDLRHQLNKVLPFVSHEETRHFLNGCYLWNGPKKLAVVATDGRALKVTTAKRLKGRQFSVILPNKAMGRLLSTFKGTYSMGFQLPEDDKKNPVQVIFKQDDVVMVSRLIEGEYPDFQMILDQNKRMVTDHEGHEVSTRESSIIVFNRETLLEVIPRVCSGQSTQPYAKTECLAIDAHADTNRLTLTYLGPTQQVAEVEAEDVSADVRVGFNPNYLMTMLKSFHADDVLMDVEFPYKDTEGIPVALHSLSPTEFQADGDESCLMPMKITSDPDPVAEHLEAGSPTEDDAEEKGAESHELCDD